MIGRVLITRAPEDCRLLQRLVADRGIVIEPYPVLRFEPVAVADQWREAVQAEAVNRRGGGPIWLVLASPRAAEPLRAQAERFGATAMLDHPVAAVGRATAEAARAADLHIGITGPGTGLQLAADMAERAPEPALCIFACGVHRRPELPNALRRQGHTVIELEVYRMVRLPPIPPPASADPIAAVVLTSPRSTRYYIENLGGRPLDCLHIALGPTTQDAARSYGIECRIPARPDMEALAEELCTI